VRLLEAPRPRQQGWSPNALQLILAAYRGLARWNGDTHPACTSHSSMTTPSRRCRRSFAAETRTPRFAAATRPTSSSQGSRVASTAGAAYVGNTS
jgi:hypothetical protein